MRAINYFKKRFEFAAKGNGTIKLNTNDVEALNQIIEFYDSQNRNTQLEDALLLFYILQNWKVENINNEKIMMVKKPDEGNIMNISDSLKLLDKICSMLNPKEYIYFQITNELWVHQALNKVPKEKWIKIEHVAELLEKELHIAKTNFTFAKQLNGNSIVKFVHKQGLSEAQRKMLGLTPH